MDERELLEQQTARNLEGLDLERAGRTDDAIELYRQNLAEGFEGDWPYGRLVGIYERRGELEQARETLERAIEVFKTSKRRTPSDRRATVRVFRNRLRLVKKAMADRNRAPRRSAASGGSARGSS